MTKEKSQLYKTAIARISDYVLKPEHDSVWITVGNISVHIRRTDEGVVVDQYPLGLADRPELASCYAFFAEAQLDIDEEAENNVNPELQNPQTSL